MESLELLQQLGFEITTSEIIAAIFFGIIGLYYFRKGRQDSSYTVTFIGLALMMYPYFISGQVLTWIAGTALWGGAYYCRNYL